MGDDFGDQDAEVFNRLGPHYCRICKQHIKDVGLLSDWLPKGFRYCQKCQIEFTGALSICNDDGRGHLTLIEVTDD